MPATPSGPDFERSPDQRVIPGDYVQYEPPRSAQSVPTLLERLRAKLRKPVRDRGPRFRRPSAWSTWPKLRRAAASGNSRRRPSGYVVPDPDDGA